MRQLKCEQCGKTIDFDGKETDPMPRYCDECSQAEREKNMSENKYAEYEKMACKICWDLIELGTSREDEQGDLICPKCQSKLEASITDMAVRRELQNMKGSNTYAICAECGKPMFNSTFSNTQGHPICKRCTDEANRVEKISDNTPNEMHPNYKKLTAEEFHAKHGNDPNGNPIKSEDGVPITPVYKALLEGASATSVSDPKQAAIKILEAMSVPGQRVIAYNFKTNRLYNLTGIGCDPSGHLIGFVDNDKLFSYNGWNMNDCIIREISTGELLWNGGR